MDFGQTESLQLGTEDFSILFWVKGNNEISKSCIFGNIIRNEESNQGFAIGASADGMALEFKVEGQNITETDWFEGALDGKWHQIAATFDRDGRMTIYMDGCKASSRRISEQAGESIDVSGLVLGADGLHRYGVRDLCIDELTVYRSLLGDEEIQMMGLNMNYHVEAGNRSARIYWEDEASTEPIYLVMNGEKYMDIEEGASELTLEGLAPDTDYTVAVVTCERSSRSNITDVFPVSFHTQCDKGLDELLDELEKAKEEAVAAKTKADEAKDKAERAAELLKQAQEAAIDEKELAEIAQEAARLVQEAVNEARKALEAAEEAAHLEAEAAKVAQESADTAKNETDTAAKEAEALRAELERLQKEMMKATSGTEHQEGTADAKPVKKVVLKSFKAGKKGTVKLTWLKVSNVSGYEILYSTKASFKKAVKKTVGSKKVSYTIKKLKSGKKYYIKMRAYRIQDGQKVYGSYSKKKITTVK